MTDITLAKLRKKLPQFKVWLTRAGAEVLEPTNEWEVARFRAWHATSVIYFNKAQKLSMDLKAKEALNAFLLGQPWQAGHKRERVRNSVDVRALLTRDGGSCFLCALPLGDDITVEHLVPIASGGTNHIANKALAHAKCNLEMDCRSLMEKIAMREARRPRPSGFVAYHQAMGLAA